VCVKRKNILTVTTLRALFRTPILWFVEVEQYLCACCVYFYFSFILNGPEGEGGQLFKVNRRQAQSSDKALVEEK